MTNSKKVILCLLLLFPGYFLSVYAQNHPDLKPSNQKPIYYSPGGTYSDWYFPKEIDCYSLEWTFIPVQDPPTSLAKAGLLHYYAYNFGLKNASGSIGSGYAGFQTNGIFKDGQKGKVINFSIWGSNGGKSKGMVNGSNDESGGFQIMLKYRWITGHEYRFELKAGPSGTDTLGKWWGLWVTDLNTKKIDFVGEQRVPAILNGKKTVLWSPHTSMFGEDLHWWRSLNGDTKYTDQASFENSAMAAVAITANGGSVKPIRFSNYTNSGKPVKADNGFESVNSNVSIYQDASNFNVQHNLGHWENPAPNVLEKIKK